MKRIYTILYIAMLALAARAQNADVGEQYIRFRMYNDNGLYAEAYQPWWEVMTANPLCSTHLYSDAVRMFSALIEDETDWQIREAYLCDLLTMYTTWQANLNALNARQTKRNRNTPADIALRQAYAFACVAPAALKDNPTWQFDEQRAYDDLRNAMRALREEKGDVLFGAEIIKAFFELSHGIFVADKAKNAAAFDEDCRAMREACEQAIEALSLQQETRSNAKALEEYFKVNELITKAYEAR